MATYAIGDIQGCYDPLCRLIEQIRFESSRDRLWFVGDLVNRGPQSLEVLRYVRSLGDAAVVVLGNHDLHLVMQSEGFGKPNAEDTLDEVLGTDDRDDLMAWLRAQPLFHADGAFAMVHAGLLPSWNIAKARAVAKEAHAALTAPNYRDFLANMWGSEPAAWSDDLTGWARLRVVVNAMTRMRYCRPDGSMEFRAPGSKSTPEQGPPGCVPWYALPNRAHADHTIVCGHWSALGYRQENGIIALDSGCLWGGSLTAVRLEDRRVFQVPCPRAVKPHGWD